MPSSFHNLPQDWRIKTLGECLKYEQPTKYIVKNTQYSNEYEIPVLTAGKSFLLGYTNDTENIFTQIPVIIFDDFTTDSKFVDFHFKVKSSAMKILHATEIADIKFVFYFMQIIQHRSDTHKRYWISEYAKLPIPLPPLETQKLIVEKLENAFAHIDKAIYHLNQVSTDIPRLKALAPLCL
ncbi:restriction endonuclease subunit S [Campylobacter sp. MIT 21-1685]|uniref:restriction endonuclease subunit S n=1 Tax=unclassified Campylobacter TaxID=2593542 RepID=UPI00224B3591|nr:MULTISPECIES: restriction endonuclease subunit S [unclassified Campylobacter]MCX2683397.1 restriction endonuclease subunit S [Campylobacter sp. MIT 21-1684]MCX2751676.1 restriction endonuclease subunit S [Campylobacter sp. MIT 21-1682]MCX2807877.1 restriction endonuclease subunit S [Campylobacter sp. MIT 21-1685]